MSLLLGLYFLEQLHQSFDNCLLLRSVMDNFLSEELEQCCLYLMSDPLHLSGGHFSERLPYLFCSLSNQLQHEI